MRPTSWVCAALVASCEIGCALGQTFPEIEPNNSEATATVTVGGMAAGNTITGVIDPQVGQDADYFLASTRPLSVGIYRHTLTLVSTSHGAVGQIQGTGQAAAAAGAWPGPVGVSNGVEAAAQDSYVNGASNSYNTWYGFGRGERFYYRVGSFSANNWVSYTATLSTVPVLPVDIGSYSPGVISISLAGQTLGTDSDFWVYDSELRAIAGFGSDDQSAYSGNGQLTLHEGFLRREYAPGTYYLAMTLRNLANSMGSPSDDAFRSGVMMDFPDIVLSSSRSPGANTTFVISDDMASRRVINNVLNAFDVNWFRFEVVPTPGVCSLGVWILVFSGRRR